MAMMHFIPTPPWRVGDRSIPHARGLNQPGAPIAAARSLRYEAHTCVPCAPASLSGLAPDGAGARTARNTAEKCADAVAAAVGDVCRPGHVHWLPRRRR